MFSVSVQKFAWESMSMLQSTKKVATPVSDKAACDSKSPKVCLKSFSFLIFLYALAAPLDDSVATSTPQSLVCWVHGPSTAWTGAYQNPHKTQALMLMVAIKKVRRRIWIRKGFAATRRNRTTSTTTTAAATPQRDHTDRTT